MLHLSSLTGQLSICLHTEFVSQVSQLLIPFSFHSILNTSSCHQQEQEIKCVRIFFFIIHYSEYKPEICLSCNKLSMLLNICHKNTLN